MLEQINSIYDEFKTIDKIKQDENKFLSINNIGLIPYLVEAIKELDNKIQYLESRETNNG